MGIEYDPTEEVEDEVDGLLDYNARADRWEMYCSEHGEIARSDDGSVASHDSMIRRWTQHKQSDHHGDGVMSFEDRMMLIEPISD